MQPRRVVVTGMGALTPVGLDVASTWDGIIHGRSGIARVQTFETDDLDVKIAGQVKGFDPIAFLDKKEARRMDRFLQLGLVAAQEAVRDAELTINAENAERIGVLVGSGIGGIGTIVEAAITLHTRGPDRVGPFVVPMMLPDMLAGMIAIQTGAKGVNFAVASACATAGHALGEAVEMIKRGDADVILAGGAEAPVTRIGLAAFDSMHALSTRNAEPEKASRPFDAERDGFVLAEAAGILVLESLEHASRRDAHIYAEITGYGATADAYHITAPSEGGEGAARAMRTAIKQAGLQPADIGYINAHGTSTPHNDRTETQAIKAVFGNQAPPVSSTKSMTGHLIGASGAIEAIICIKTILEGCLPPTINQEHPDPECDLDYVPNMARSKRIDTALSNSLGFGGHNTALVVSRFD
ncbi:MAG: beta-ketoacyl-ACP synthase II [Chloroflexi bacterium]|nr:beta-ketoacyl-ACP synthase II [Chloroflexota bacterium]MBV9895709.1 beta-ketoacyl-ACP synthase II [Chloroflexota bacterium]